MNETWHFFVRKKGEADVGGHFEKRRTHELKKGREIFLSAVAQVRETDMRQKVLFVAAVALASVAILGAEGKNLMVRIKLIINSF